MFTVLPALPVSVPLNREVYLIAGQSNAEGRGFLTDMPDLFPHDRVLMYRDSGWVPAKEPTAIGAGVGPGLAFGTCLAALRPNKQIGIVNCAYGGSALADWARGSSLYTAMVQKGQVAQQWGRLKGIIFDQGESDAMTTYAVANAWDTNFLGFVEDMRFDLGIAALPIVFAIKRSNPNLSAFPYWDAMLTAERRVRGSGIASIEESDLSFRSDAPEQVVHLSTAGQLIAGQRFAAAMNGLLGA